MPAVYSWEFTQSLKVQLMWPQPLKLGKLLFYTVRCATILWIFLDYNISKSSFDSVSSRRVPTRPKGYPTHTAMSVEVGSMCTLGEHFTSETRLRHAT